jgi:hypothetical protein
MRGRKWTFEQVKNFVEIGSNSGCRLLSESYKNTDSKLEIMCECGEVFYKTFAEFRQLERKMCRKCILENNSKYDIEFVKKFVEVESNSGCKLFSAKYKNVDENMHFLCPCGDDFFTPFKEFLSNKKRCCNKCNRKQAVESQRLGYEYVKYCIEVESNSGCKLLSENYVRKNADLDLECKCGNPFKRSFQSFEISKNNCCVDCLRQINLSKSKERLLRKLHELNFHFLEWLELYTGVTSRFLAQAPCGHIINTCENNLQQKNSTFCKECRRISFIGSNNPSYKGGRTPLYDHLRKTIDPWKRDSMERCNYKCVITGGEFDIVHHLYPFNKILQETIDALNLIIHKNIGDYTEEELKIIENTCLELHYKYGFGVCLREDIHILFHRLYEKGNNTPEQFEEFKQRYWNGEFKEVI